MLIRRTPLRAKGKPYKPAIIRFHMERVAGLGCLVCGGPATLHHCTGYADRIGRFARSDKLVVPLAPEYHLIQHGPHTSVEALGHRGFYETYGIDLLAQAEWLWAETERLWDDRSNDHSGR